MKPGPDAARREDAAEHEIVPEWAEFECVSEHGHEFTHPSKEGHFGHTKEYGSVALSVDAQQLRGFAAAGRAERQCTFTKAPVGGWLLITDERPQGPGTPRRAFCYAVPFDRLAGAGYETLIDALPSAEPANEVTLKLRPQDPAETAGLLNRIGFERCLDICAAVITKPPVSIPGGGLTSQGRLQVLDAVTALLPYGARALLRVTTHEQSSHRVKVLDGHPAHEQGNIQPAFDLYFTDSEQWVEDTRRRLQPSSHRGEEYQATIRGILRLLESRGAKSPLSDLVSGLRDMSESMQFSRGPLSDTVREQFSVPPDAAAISAGYEPPPVSADLSPATARHRCLSVSERRRLLSALGTRPDTMADELPGLLRAHPPDEIIKWASAPQKNDDGRWAEVPRVLCLAGIDRNLDTKLRRWLNDKMKTADPDHAAPRQQAAMFVDPARAEALLDLVVGTLDSFPGDPPPPLLRTLSMAFENAWAEPLRRMWRELEAEEAELQARKGRRLARRYWLDRRVRDNGRTR